MWKRNEKCGLDILANRICNYHIFLTVIMCVSYARIQCGTGFSESSGFSATENKDDPQQQQQQQQLQLQQPQQRYEGFISQQQNNNDLAASMPRKKQRR